MSKIITRAGLVAAVLALVGLSYVQGQSKDANTAQIERGRYLAEFGGCYDCHSPKVMKDGAVVEDQARHLMGHPAEEIVTAPGDGQLGPNGWIAGSNQHFTAWAGPWGITFAANLTPDKKTGLGNWTFEQFRDALRKGKHRGFGRPIMPPMPWMNCGLLNDDDLAALFAYLQSIPPIENQVPDWIKPAGAARN